jgi:hypothetical protein
LGFELALLSFSKFHKSNDFNIEKYTTGSLENNRGYTKDYWPIYGLVGAVGTTVGWI